MMTKRLLLGIQITSIKPMAFLKLKKKKIFKRRRMTLSIIVKFVFAAKRHLEIHWFLLVNVKEHANSFMLIVSEHGSIARSKNRSRESPRVIILLSSNVKYVNFLSQKWFDVSQKTLRWWQLRNQTNLIFFSKVFAISSKIKRNDACI